MAVEVPIVLPDDLLYAARQKLAEQGTTLDDFVRLKLKGLINRKRFFAIDEKFTFGKYEGEFVEVVIAGDPSYVAWCLRTIDDFGLTPGALQMLAETGVDL